MRGKLFAFSGIDGAGKSTQIEFFQNWLNEKKVPNVYLWSRGGNTPGANFIKNASRKLSLGKLPKSGHSSDRNRLLKNQNIQKYWLLLGMIDLIRIYGFWIRWQQFLGRTVVCDRYIDDTFIDFKVLFPNQNFENWKIWKMLIYLAPTPNKKCFLDIPIEISHKRCMEKYEPFPDTEEQRKRRYSHYEVMSKDSSLFRLNALLDKWEVHRQIRDEIKDIIF